MSSKVAHIIEEKERTDDICFKESTPFHKMLLKDVVKKGLDNCGFVYPTVIQANAIPIGKAGIDLLCQSKSGTGKTLIFCTILLEQYQELLREPQSLILVPTREIAIQIEGILNQIGEHLPGFRAVTVIGGLEVNNDRKKLALAKAVVGTPGRVLHLINNDMLNTSKIQLFIIDEADKMMSKTFLNDFQKINKSLPKKKQMIACSATFCDDLDKKIASYMKNPLLVSTDKGATLLIGIKQLIYDIPEQKTSILEMTSKLRILKKIFSKISFKQCLAFVSSQSRAESYKNTMEKDGWPCEVITGAQDQKTRIEIFRKFKEFKTRILFATDLMARGIDSEHVNLVLNIEPPDDGPTYLHRIGRAGRFGSHGIAITFIASQKELEKFKTITESIGSGLNLFKYPINDNMLDIWNFTQLEADGILDLYNFNELHSDKVENFLNDTSSPVNSTSETATPTPTAPDNNVNSKTYKIEYLDHDSNANKILLTETMSSLQRLPSSNTIDDASSIAVDSDVLRSNSIGSRDLKIPKKASTKNKRTNNNSMSLLEVLIDNSKSSSTENIDLFDDYKSFDAITANNSQGDGEGGIAGKSKTDETIINRINLKDLLVDQPTKKTKKPTKDAFSEYEKLNNNENGGLDLNDLTDSNSYSITTTSQQYEQSATDTSRLPLKEELNLKIPQIEGESSSQSTQEKLQKPHFPSPNNCNDSGGGGDADNELSNFQHINAAVLAANNNDSDSTDTNDSIASNASSSSFEGVSTSSSGFDERTTSAKTSGISTSNDEDDEDDSFDYNASFEDDEIEDDDYNYEEDLYDEVEEEYENDDDNDNDDEETYQTSDSDDVNDNPETDFIPPPTTFSDITNNEITNQTNDKNVFQSCSYHEYVNDIGPNVSGNKKPKINSRNNVTPIPSSSNQNHYYSTVADNNQNSPSEDQEKINLMYQNAYARWTDLYWNQMTQIQDYVRFCKYVKKNHL